ncbi:MAG: hypothetical protein ABJJ69_18700, partial [Paracoccaceae bacterium]
CESIRAFANSAHTSGKNLCCLGHAASSSLLILSMLSEEAGFAVSGSKISKIASMIGALLRLPWMTILIVDGSAQTCGFG